MLPRINSLEKNINDLMELKTYTSINSQIDQAEERILEIEDQPNDIKRKVRLEKEE